MKKKINNRTLASLLGDSAPFATLFAIMVGGLAGIFYSLTVPLLLYALIGNGPEAPELELKNNTPFSSSEGVLAWVFFANCLLILFAKSASIIVTNYIAKGAAAKLRIELFKKISQLSITKLESIGSSKIITILTRDIQTVAAVSYLLPVLWVSGVTVLGLLGYLALINFNVFVFVILALLVGIITFQLPMLLATKFLEKARSRQDNIQDGIKGLVLGAYELKLSSKKASEFLKEELISPELDALRNYRIGDCIVGIGITYGDLIAFGVIGIIAFYIPYVYPLSFSEILGVTIVILYITGPVSVILGSLPQLKNGNISLSRIAELEALVDEPESTNTMDQDDVPPWTHLRLVNAAYHYENTNDDSFHLSPVSLTFEKGSVNFIVGANGSGKTTLAKIISTHYLADDGKIYLDEMLVNEDKIDVLRCQIFSIYSSYYLFKKLYGFGGSHDENKVKRYLEYFDLTGKTSLEDGRFSTINLSDGQRRRLALMTALLEDKNIYIFDEWAADQDPRFKKIFYTKILAELKADGKLVIVITHDDRYFEFADRIIKMDSGQVCGDEYVFKKGNKVNYKQISETA